jgi:UDP-GlcNAc:undecaprenyl-phosphate GlcNAc-1-phosphate transferase
MNKKDTIILITSTLAFFVPVFIILLLLMKTGGAQGALKGLSLLFLCLFSFICSYLLVPVAKFMARYLHVLDIPDGKIKLHTIAIPYLGGVAVYLGWLIPLSLIALFMQRSLSYAAVFLLIGCTLLLLLGLIDDVFVLKPSQKFGGQCLVALFFLYGGFYLQGIGCTCLSIALSGLWILTIINAFNLIDVMDGLSSTIAIFSALGFLLIAVYLQDWFAIPILASLIGALCGFLIFNFPPASIYLGDAGSLFIGGLLGALPLKLNFAQCTVLGYLAPIIILALPLLELTSLIVIRAYKKIPFYNGSPDHFSIYLQQHGWSKNLVLSYVRIMMFILIVVSFGAVSGFVKLYQIIFSALIFLLFWFVFLLRGSF